MGAQPQKTRQDHGQRPRHMVSNDLVVTPGWLLRALLVVLLFAMVCGYATFCWMFSQGAWQLMLHPRRTTEMPARIGETPVDLVRFGAAASGVPQLTGWWIAPVPGGRYAHLTVLFLSGADGSLLNNVPTLTALHGAGVGVFGVDYRGYGQSAEIHPSERRMTEDAEMAWEYLAGTRRLRGEDVVPYGVGVGASLAMRLAEKQTAVQALVLDDPDTKVMERVAADPRVRLLPVRWLLKDRFEIFPALSSLRKPKLIVTRGMESRAILGVAAPKMTLALPIFDPAEFAVAMRRFLDQYAPPTPVPLLVPPATPSTTRP